MEGVSQSKSYRSILRASSIIGSASVANVLVGLLRMKLAAVLLGPSGIGAIGLLQNLLVVASALASLGIGTVGARQIATAQACGAHDDLARARRALFTVTLLCAAIGFVVVLGLAEPLARNVIGDAGQGSTVTILAFGVGLTVLTAYQTATLTGLRRLGDVARLSVWSSVGSTCLAVFAILVFRDNGVIAFVMATPVVSVLLGWRLVAHLPSSSPIKMEPAELYRRWSEIVTLGVAFTLAGAALNVAMLAVRTLIQRDLGEVALGQFQAAWYISVTYLAFVLQAMSTDFYPRLSAVIDRPHEAIRIINEQTEVALAIAAPILIGLIGVAPWLMSILYAREFGAGAIILQWQVLADVLKIAAWPLGFSLLASNRGWQYLFTESVAAATLVIGVAVGLARFGIQASGIAVLMMYMVYLPMMWVIARRQYGFRWSSVSVRSFLRLAAMSVGTFALSGIDPWLGLVSATVCCGVAGYFAFATVSHALPDGLRRRLPQRMR